MEKNNRMTTADHVTHFVGADCGGSSARVRIETRDGVVLGVSTAPGANATTSFEIAVKNLSAAIADAQAQAGLSPDQLRRCSAFVGMAGVMDKATADRMAAALPFDLVEVSDDRPTALVGALGQRDGAVAAIGTGSFVGRTSSFERQFVGGWGLPLADQASGAWLGRNLLSDVLAWQDGFIDSSPLLVQTLEKFGTAAAIVAFAFDGKPVDFAPLAPEVISAAGSGDPAGQRLLRSGGDYISKSLDIMGHKNGEPLCLLGGIGPFYEPYLDEKHRAAVTPPAGTALDGAVVLARRLAT
jgi:glucosamine kinase